MGVVRLKANEELKQLYYDPKNGFGSFTKFYKIVRDKHPNITTKQIKQFLEKQETYQVNKQVNKPKVYNTILANKVGDSFQIDFMIYDRYEIDKYKYILCCVDVYSRYAQCRAMTSRNNDALLEEIKDIFHVMGVPKNINADQEFNTKILLDYFNKTKIVCHFSEVGEINKNAIVERFNRTLAGLIQKWRVATKQIRSPSGRSLQWYKVLGDLVDGYNKCYHRTIKASPAEVFNGKAKNRQEIRFVPQIFKVGDIVRLKEEKKILGKGDFIKYSEETYIIIEKKGTRYKLEDVKTGKEPKRMYKEYEMIGARHIQYLEPREGESGGTQTIRGEEEAKKKEKRIAKEMKQIDAKGTNTLGSASEGGLRRSLRKRM
jgi:hypothetical protein